MNNSDSTRAARHERPHKPKLSRDTVFLIGDLLPLLDFTGVLLAAYLGTLAYANWFAPAASAAIWNDVGRAALAAAVLAPFILCDRAFVSFASGGQTAAMVRCFAVRFLMFAGVVAAIGLASRSLVQLPGLWLVLWFASSLLLTALMRLLLIANLRYLERKGILTETIAIIGAGPVSDGLIRHLQKTRGGTVEIVGVFDDRAGRSAGCLHKPAGSLTELIELGKQRPMDWILLALPGSAESRMEPLVHRLKTLAVPVGLCPPNLDLALPCREDGVRYLGGSLPVTLLADRSRTRSDRVIAAMETVLPRWIITLLGLPFVTLGFLFTKLRKIDDTPACAQQDDKLVCTLDHYDLDRFTHVAARFGQERFGYVVTPNADHLLRLHRQSSFRTLYAEAAYVLLDSRFVSHLLRFTRRLALPVCTGSDLTAKLFGEIIAPDDHLVLIGSNAQQAARLGERFGLNRLAHFDPPMGFIHDPAAVEACLRFVEANSPFRYCLLAVGSPQQEIIAHQLKERGIARGLALCIGSSIGFLTGRKQRAPLWMQRSGLEWLFRLVHAPRRLAKRYLVEGPKIFGLLRRTSIVLRAPADSPQSVSPAPAPSSITTAFRITRRPPTAFSRKLDRLPKAVSSYLVSSDRVPAASRGKVASNARRDGAMSEAATAP